MTREEKIALAIAMRSADRPATLAAVARRLGVSSSTVLRWTDPRVAEDSRVKARAWKAEHPEQVREWELGHRGVCACGASISRTGSQCEACYSSRGAERHAEVARLYRDGLTVREIAAQVHMTPGSVGTLIVRLRKAGVDVPHHYKRRL
jgi:transposase